MVQLSLVHNTDEEPGECACLNAAALVLPGMVSSSGMFESGQGITDGWQARQVSGRPRQLVTVKLPWKPSHAQVTGRAALAAGMRALAVTTTHPRGSFSESGAARIVDSLAEVDIEMVRELLN